MYVISLTYHIWTYHLSQRISTTAITQHDTALYWPVKNVVLRTEVLQEIIIISFSRILKTKLVFSKHVF